MTSDQTNDINRILMSNPFIKRNKVYADMPFFDTISQESHLPIGNLTSSFCQSYLEGSSGSGSRGRLPAATGLQQFAIGLRVT
jgi:hypothetical protein